MSASRFEVPGQPVPKARARVVNGHSFTPERTRKAEEAVAWCARAAKVPLRTGPVALTVVFFSGDKRRRDLDNMIKLVGDGLNGIAWSDDNQIVSIEAHKYSGPVANARTVVTIEDVEPS